MSKFNVLSLLVLALIVSMLSASAYSFEAHPKTQQSYGIDNSKTLIINNYNFGNGNTNNNNVGFQNQESSGNAGLSAGSSLKSDTAAAKSSACMESDCEQPEEETCPEEDCEQVAPDAVDDYECIETAPETANTLNAFFIAETAHLIREDTRIPSFDSLLQATEGQELSEDEGGDAEMRANALRGLWNGFIVRTSNNKVYALALADHGGRTIECFKVNRASDGSYKFTSIGWAMNQNSGSGNYIPSHVTVNELWQIDY